MGIEIHEIVTADGEVFALDNGADRWIATFGGYGLSAVEYVTERGYGQDGVTVIDHYLQERTIALQYGAAPCSRAALWEARRWLIEALRTNRGGDFWLRHWRSDGTLREIQARYGGGAEFAPANPAAPFGAFSIDEELQLLCADPVWYGDSHALMGTLAATAELVFPFTCPFIFATNTIYMLYPALAYVGDYPSFPRLEVEGPANSVYFANNTLGVHTSYIYPIAGGVTVAIEWTREGQPVVTSSLDTATNHSYSDAFASRLTRDSRPLETVIAPPPAAPGGVNDLTITVGGASAATQATLLYRDRYQGI